MNENPNIKLLKLGREVMAAVGCFFLIWSIFALLTSQSLSRPTGQSALVLGGILIILGIILFTVSPPSKTALEASFWEKSGVWLIFIGGAIAIHGLLRHVFENIPFLPQTLSLSLANLGIGLGFLLAALWAHLELRKK